MLFGDKLEVKNDLLELVYICLAEKHLERSAIYSDGF